MKKNICIFILTFWFSQFTIGQRFSFVSTNPFGLQNSTESSESRLGKIIFYDTDSDEDLDAILVGIDSINIVPGWNYSDIKYFIDVQENTGTKLKPAFATRKPYSIHFPYPNGIFAPSIGDLNHDGLIDFIVCCDVDSSLNLKTQFYERKSAADNQPFEILDSDSLRLAKINSGSFFIPELADMDMDGDLDLLMTGYLSEFNQNSNRERKGAYLYAKNIGSLSHPIFYGWHPSPYGLIASDYPQYAVVGDIDNDNDNDILSMIMKSYRGKPDTLQFFSFIENIPQSNGKPSFLAGVNFPFGLPVASERTDTIFGHSLVDIDADGDLDLFVVQNLKSTGKGIGYYENNLCSTSSSMFSQQICQGDSVMVGSQVFKTTGEHFVSFEKPDRCDSTVHLSLTVFPAVQQNLTEVICPGESYIVGNQAFTQTGQYQINLITGNGCDSTIQLNLTVDPLTSTSLTASVCEGESATIGTQSFNQTGYYTVTLSNINGCDSIVNFGLTVFPKSTTNLTASVCEGESATIGTQSFNQTGQYTVTLSNINGCDSIVNFGLTVFPKSTTNLTTSVCEGESATIGTQIFNQTGQYTFTLDNINGCDSVVQLNLTVNPKQTTNLVKTLCSGSSYVIGNQTFTQSGQFEVKLKTIFGCDSIVNATLTFITLDGNVTEFQNGLTANQNGAQYQWFDCTNNTDIDGATNQTFKPVKNGKYGVRITDFNNCQISSTCYDFVLTGTEVLILSNRITLFPNPSDGYFTILNNTGYTLTGIKIINSTGITERILPYYEIERISTAGLPQGMYIIEMECNGMRIYKKIAINKN